MTQVSSRQLYFRLLGFVRPYWSIFALAILFMVLGAATEPLFPALMKPLVDGSFSSAEKPYPTWFYPLAIIGIFFFRGLFSFLSGYGMNWLSNSIVADVRNFMFQRIVTLPTRYFEANASGSLLSKLIYDVSGISDAVTSALTVTVRDSMTVIGLFTWLLYLNWKLTIITIVVLPLIALISRATSLRMRKLSLSTQGAFSAFVQTINEALRAHKVIKIYGGQKYEIERFRSSNRTLRGFGLRFVVVGELLSPIVQLLAACAVALIVYVALQQVEGGQTTAGGFVSFITAMLMLLAPIKRLTDVSSRLQKGLAAAESIFALLDEPPETDAGHVDLGRARGEVSFDQVKMRYENADRNALSDFTLTIRPGQTVALVGPSGSGKTTIANLVPRFYEPQGGSIRIDGHDLRDIALESLRSNVAMVSQETILFDDTIAANIAYGSMRGATMAEIEAAARAAHAYEFIQQLPEGFATIIGENGVKLSGGQRQRLSIARAILKNAPILLLDEATSALDTESERHVQAALETLMENRTTLVIAHRLSTVERADRIVVLQDGRIVEQGSHQELVANQGLYSQLYRMQFSEAAGVA